MPAVTVALVGAGPGDPELMTLRAEVLLGEAEVVVTDSSLLHLVRRFAPRAVVVAVPDREPAVAVVLVETSPDERSVVRLYVGDPWLHPAHGVELDALGRAGITTVAVAGVSTELGAPALAGIAPNVRHLAVTCTIGPVAAMPPAVDPARTLLVLTSDGAAAARAMAAIGAPLMPAAIVPLGQRTETPDATNDAGGAGAGPPADVIRGTLGEVGLGVSLLGPSMVVVGAVADPVRDAER